MGEDGRGKECGEGVGRLGLKEDEEMCVTRVTRDKDGKRDNERTRTGS